MGGRSQSEIAGWQQELRRNQCIIISDAGMSRHSNWMTPNNRVTFWQIENRYPMDPIGPETKPVRTLARPHRASPDMPEHADTIEAGSSIVSSRSWPVKLIKTSPWKLANSSYQIVLDI
jgi:hypothetical protein